MEMKVKYSFCLYNTAQITRDFIDIDDKRYLYTTSTQDNFTEIMNQYATEYTDPGNKHIGRLNGIILPLDINYPEKTLSKFKQLMLLQ